MSLAGGYKGWKGSSGLAAGVFDGILAFGIYDFAFVIESHPSAESPSINHQITNLANNRYSRQRYCFLKF